MSDVSSSVPSHVAIILDGNGRWAEQQSLDRMAGHKAGAEAARDILQAAGEAKIPYLTLFCFSSENWRRPEEEVSALMELMEYYLAEHIDDLLENKVRLKVIGERQNLSSSAVQQIQKAEKLTNFPDPSLQLILALNYGGRWDICQATKKLAEDVSLGKIASDDIDEDMIDEALATADIPPPDLLIRSGGEKRLSNFLLWQMAYSELIFTDKPWPAFSKQDFSDCLQEYTTRTRRFGS